MSSSTPPTASRQEIRGPALADPLELAPGAVVVRPGRWDGLRASVQVVIFLILLGVGWEAAVAVTGVHPVVLPPPSDVLAIFVGRVPLFARSMADTLLTIAYGFGLGSLFGILSGIAMYSSRRLRRAFYPYLVALYVVPKAVFIPLLVLWIGVGLGYKVLVTFLLAFFPVTDNTLKGLEGVSRDLVDMGRSLRASRAYIFSRLQLPSSLPFIFAGMRIGVSEAFVGAVLSELMVPHSGIGSRIMEAVGPSNTDFILAGIVLIAGVGMLSYAVMEFLERRLLFWHYE